MKYDLVIIGGGSAAFGAAIKASEFDAKVAMVEASTLGGTCVNVGCVPSKNLLHVGEQHYYPRHPAFESLSSCRGEFDFRRAIAEKDEIVQRLRKTKYSDVIDSLPNTKLIRGRAVFVSPKRIQVDGQTIEGEKFILATGSSPNIIPFPGLDQVDYLTNVEALSLSKRPESLVVLGGRALALEFAQMYAHFGSQVTVLQRSDRIIPEEEPEISEALRTYLEEEDIKIYTGAQVKRVKNDRGRKVVTASVAGKEREFEGEQLLMATGRRPNTKDMGLEIIGIEIHEDGAIKVDNEMHTSAPHIWAAGDVIGQPMLETVAAKEGAVAAENALTGSHRKINFLSVPHAIFTSPQVASVGLTEAEAMQRYRACACRTLDLSLVPKAVAVKDTRGLIKMVIHPKTTRIVGVHLLAPLAADIIHEGVLAVKFRLTIDDVIDTIHVFPTMAEAIKLVALSFRKDVSKLSCCAE